MVKYKTYEAVKILTENRNVIFRPLSFNSPSDLMLKVDKEGIIRCYSQLEEYDLNINDEWYMVEDSVSFEKVLMAMADGKYATCILDGEFSYYSPIRHSQMPIEDNQGYGISLGEILFGTWFINNEEECINE